MLKKGAPVRGWVCVWGGGEEGEGGTPTPSRKTLRFIKQSLFNKREPPCVSECVWGGGGEGGWWNSYSTRKTLRFIKRSSELPIFVEYASSECYSI